MYRLPSSLCILACWIVLTLLASGIEAGTEADRAVHYPRGRILILQIGFGIGNVFVLLLVLVLDGEEMLTYCRQRRERR